MKTKTILFDLDGCLIHSWPFIMASFDHVLSHFGFPKDGLAHPKMRHCTLLQAYEHLGLSLQADTATRLHLEFQNTNTHLIHAFPASALVLENCNSRFHIGVVSNRQKNTAQLLRHCNLFDHVDLIISAEDVFRSKPHPEGIFQAMEYFGTHPEHTVMVGDTPPDILAGKAAGVSTIAIDGSDCLEELRKAKPNYLLRDMSELIPLLDHI